MEKNKIEYIKEERKTIRENTAYYEAKEMSELEDSGKSLREIGKKFGMTYEAVRQRIIKYKAGLFGSKLK